MMRALPAALGKTVLADGEQSRAQGSLTRERDCSLEAAAVAVVRHQMLTVCSSAAAPVTVLGMLQLLQLLAAAHRRQLPQQLGTEGTHIS